MLLQVEWDKCEEDWMNDEGLFSKRQLGYCEVQCGKCRCDDPETCRDVPLKDIKAKNGVLHVSRRHYSTPSHSLTPPSLSFALRR